ncbi:MAG: hypothetical protein ACRBN8_34090 [Nannocystales bacterium]
MLPLIVRTRLGEGVLSFALPLEPANVAKAEAFVGDERQCCGFAQFDSRVDASQGLVWVELTASPAHQSVLVEMAQALGPRTPDRRWLSLGLGGAAAGFAGLLCCATPLVVALAGLMGLGTASLAGFVDVTSAAILVTSLGAVTYWAVLRRRRTPQPRCGCSG